MIVKIAQVYNNVAQESGLDLEVVTSIGNTVFSTLLEKLMKPDEIAYELPKLGTFVMKHKPFDKYHSDYMHYVKKGFLKNEVDIQRVNGVKEKIESFRKIKKEAREKRNEYKSNISSEIRAQQSSQD